MIRKVFQKVKNIDMVEVFEYYLLWVLPFLLLISGIIYCYQLDSRSEIHQLDKAKKDISQLSKIILEHRYQVGTYPANISWDDPWEQSYLYSQDGTKFAIWSKGKNKANNSTETVPITFTGDDIGFAFSEN